MRKSQPECWSRKLVRWSLCEEEKPQKAELKCSPLVLPVVVEYRAEMPRCDGLASSLNTTGKSNRGMSMYRKRFSDLVVSAAWISSILRKASLSSQSDLAMSPRSYFFTSCIAALSVLAGEQAVQPTFSSLPISSRTPILLGVVVSAEASASLPGQRSSLCLPLRRVLCDMNHPQLTWMQEHIPLLAEQPEGRSANRSGITRSCYVPHSEGDLCIQREVTVADGKGDPFIPAEDD
jgi:hypothetical protein